jgi:hypothetical protein
MSDVQFDEMGFFGNIWIRKLTFPTVDTKHEGHVHPHDHMSQLWSGSVLVEVEGFKPQVFKAPTFISIKKEHEHKITALEDHTVWFCLFAFNDTGNVDLVSQANDPYREPILPLEEIEFRI